MKIEYENSIYEGEVLNGLPHGYGKEIHFPHDEGISYTYEGEFFNGLKHGKGKEIAFSGRTFEGFYEEGKKIKYLDGRVVYNAIRVWPLGNMDLIYIDFKDLKSLCSPLNCSSVNIIKTKEMAELSQIIDAEVVAYCDANGAYNDPIPNPIIQTISGYQFIPGACVICGFDKDYAPLSAETCDILYDCLTLLYKQMKGQ